jgi:hypothetical protein
MLASASCSLDSFTSAFGLLVFADEVYQSIACFAVRADHFISLILMTLYNPMD